MARLTIALSLVALLVAGCGRQAMATAPSSGPNFNVELRVSHASSYAAVGIQPDGKVVVVLDQDDARFVLARFTKRGRLDPTFGTGGTVDTSLGPSFDAVAYALAVQPDGKIVVVGHNGHGFALARYTVDGALDTSFGADGRVLTRLGGTAYAVAIQPDGKIVIAGEGMPAQQMDHLVHSGMVARYTTTGTLDTSFGDGGLVTTYDAKYDALALQPDGKIVVAGIYNDGGGAEIDRYTPNGKIDTSFGDIGEATSPEWFPVEYQAVALQPDGKIVGAGSSDGRLGVDRYTMSGAPDKDFGSGGHVETSFGHSSYATVYALAVGADANIVAAGSATAAPRHYGHNLTRAWLTPSGRLDPSFGAGGTLTTPVRDNSASIDTVAIEPDGKFVIVASTQGGFVVARYPG